MFAVYTFNMPTRPRAVKSPAHATSLAPPIPPRDPGRYHHGALRAALLAGAEAVLAERGVDGFSLREVARRVGVSPTAPQRHFADARALLTAVAVAGHAQFADVLAAADAAAVRAAGDDPRARLRALAVAYVTFALDHPARFDVMWRGSRIDRADPAYVAAGRRAFGLLQAAVAGVPAAVVLDDPARRAAAAQPLAADPRVLLCWTVVHGYARLALDGAFGPGGLAAAHAAAEALLPALVDRLAL